MKISKKLRFPRVKINYGLLIKYGVILLLLLSIVFGIKFLIQKKIDNDNKHDSFRGNIENLYYYIKKEPKNMELFAILKKGDGVTVSVWENYVSTSEDAIKNYEKQIKSDLATGKNFPERVLYAPLQKALDLFKILRIQNRERIESRKTFNKEKYALNRSALDEMLKQIAADAKKVGLDLR